jgi:AbrB family looped-hinge helix DNA binding protein
MRITSKGQVTIPIELRERTGLLPNTEVDFGLEGEKITITRATRRSKKPTRGEQIVARLRGRGDIMMTTDEIMALTRGDG